MRFTTELVARLPRSRCAEHGVKTIVSPWAGKHSRFTLLFEAFAVEVLQACRTVNAAAALLGLSWDAVQTIMDRAVERGLDRRGATPIKHLGIDEKSFGKGKDYITVLTDLDGSRVLDLGKEDLRERCGLRHMATIAGRTHAPSLAGERHDKPRAALD